MAVTSSTGPGAAPSGELRWEFWVLVVIVNVALLATAVGILVLFFRSRVTIGAGLLAVGLGATGYAWYRYRRVVGRSTGRD